MRWILGSRYEDGLRMNAERPTSNSERPSDGGSRTDAERPSTANGKRKYDLENRLLNYAVMILKVVEQLPNTRTGNHIAGQLVRCGTSPLPNHGEAEAAESAADFAHKLKICLKEFRESKRWLLLIQRARLLTDAAQLCATLQETEELIRIFVASLRTVERQKQERIGRKNGLNVEHRTSSFERRRAED
jgi:four helix bundle protein